MPDVRAIPTSAACSYCGDPECNCTVMARQHGYLGTGCTCGNPRHASSNRGAEPSKRDLEDAETLRQLARDVPGLGSAIPNSAAENPLPAMYQEPPPRPTFDEDEVQADLARVKADATPNSAAERHEQFHRDAGLLGARDATRNRVWDYPTIYAAILNSINRSGYRIEGPNQDSDVNASDLADCIVTELLEGDS